MDFLNLNSHQKKAVLAKDGPLLIVAGAGTGKTKTLTSRLIYLIKKGIRPENICAITFTNKAAKEMLDRIFKNISNKKNLKNLFIGTFHSLGAKILRLEAPIFGRNKNFVIFDDSDSFTLIKSIIKKNNIKEPPGFFYDKISEIKNFSPYSKNFLTKDDHKLKLVADVYEIYEKELEKNNAFDFDDLIQKPTLLFKQKIDVLDKYQNKFKYILVDEYQDLNNVQYEMIKLLAGRFKNINVVGDDAQTIYSWRGSNIEIFLSFERDWPKAQIVFLEENYRSTSNILTASQSLISKNIYQYPKNLWTKNPPGELIKIIEVANEDEEAFWVANKIEEIIKEKKHKSVAILYRINAQSRAIEQILNLKSIPYKIFGGIRFYERKEIKDVLAGLRLIYNHSDLVSLERLKKIFNKKTLLDFLEKTQNKNKDAPLKLIDLFLKTTNYLNYLEKNTSNFEERLQNIEELIHFTSSFDNLEDFLEKVALLQPHDQEGGKNKKSFLELMTIHLAKGLEFDCVFVLGANEGILPHRLSFKSIYELEEERRLMYVAMTRAKKELFISFYKEPSRFLFDVPKELVEFESLVSEENNLVDNQNRYINLD